MLRQRRPATARDEMRKKEKLGIKMLRKGMRAADVARDKRIDVHPTTVQRWAKKHDIELTYPYNRHSGREDLVNKSEIVRLRKMKNSRGRPLFTRIEIAGLCECSESYVKQVIAKAKEDGLL